MLRDELLNIFANCDFEGDIHSNNFKEKIIDHLPQDFICDYDNGVSKVCIIPVQTNFVIKIPFNSSKDNYFYEEESEFFCNANSCFGHEWDYCFTELLLYNLAKKEKIDKAFCKTRLLGCVNNYPIYIQEKASTVRSLIKKVDNISSIKKKGIKYCQEKKFSCFDSSWIGDAIQYYGEKRANKIMSFIDKHQIGDLYEDNIGYIGNRPVLIDFSDYCS